jgi:hypothetical protein
VPKCLDCNNIVKFSYNENSYNEAEYNSEGELIDVTYKEYFEIDSPKCMICESNNVEGEI